MYLLIKLNASVENMVASQEEIRNTFPAQPERNPRGQNPESTMGGPKHEHAKAITILRSGKTLEMDFPPLTPIVMGDEEEDEVEDLEKKDKFEEKVVEEEELERN